MNDKLLLRAATTIATTRANSDAISRFNRDVASIATNGMVCVDSTCFSAVASAIAARTIERVGRAEEFLVECGDDLNETERKRRVDNSRLMSIEQSTDIIDGLIERLTNLKTELAHQYDQTRDRLIDSREGCIAMLKA